MASPTNISFGGQSQGSGAWAGIHADDNELFLKVFSGEVLASFEKYTVTNDKHRVRMISSGKSAQFPFTGRTTARRYIPGTDILMDNAGEIGTGNASAATVTPALGLVKAAEKVITIDDLLISTCFIDNLDLAKSHYDYRGAFSRELGRSMAFEFDTNVMKSVLVDQLANAAVDDPFVRANMIQLSAGASEALLLAETDGVGIARLIDALFTISAQMDSKYVPSEERYVFVTPAIYNGLITAGISGTGTALINRDYNSPNGSLATGQVLQVCGMTVVKTPHLPQTDTRWDDDGGAGGTDPQARNPGEHNDYQGYFTDVAALVMHPEACGTVKLQDLTLESEYVIRHQGNLMVAKMACGTGALRSECGGVIRYA